MNKFKELLIIHLGLGNVGKEVKQIIEKQKEKIQNDFGVSLVYRDAFTSRTPEEEIKKTIQLVSLPFVLIDTTASDKTVSLIELALKKGGFVVMSNKKLLTQTQQIFDRLHIYHKNLFYETTVGAGLPIIKTLEIFLTTADDVIEIQGCFSGTLGFIFSEVEKGSLFSEAVLKAKKMGFTEPDPRDDLSGIDVARKALIIARMLGQKIELQNISLQGLYPKKMETANVEQFLKDISQLDKDYAEKIEKAKQEKKVLRFVAKITKKTCTVGLEAVAKSSDIGTLSGPDNIVIIKSKRYFTNPLVIKGPGAGIEVTAQGVVGDMLEIVKKI